MGKKYITDIVSIGDHSLDAAGMVQIDALIADGLHSDAGYLKNLSDNSILDWTTDRGDKNIHSGNYFNTQLTSAQIAGMGYTGDQSLTHLLPKAGGSMTGDIDMLGNNIIIDSEHGFINSGAWMKNTTPYGYILFGPANTGHAHIYTDRSNFYFNKYIQVLGGSRISKGDIKANVFYDIEDTSYYIHPAQESKLKGLTVIDKISGNIDSSNTAINLYGLGSIQSTSSGVSYTNNYQVRENKGGGSNTAIAGAPQLGFHWSGVVASSILMEANGTISIRNNPGTGYENFTAKTIKGTGDVRAPIFYDSSDTNYYGNFQSTSRLKGLTVIDKISGDISGDANTVDGSDANLSYGAGRQYDFTVNGNADTYYPVVISGSSNPRMTRLSIFRSYSETGPNTWNTSSHKGGLTLDLDVRFGGWGGYPNMINVHDFGEIYARLCGGAHSVAHTMKFVVYLRGGGGAYHIDSPNATLSIEVNDSTSASNYKTTNTWYAYDHSNNGYDVTVTAKNLAAANVGANDLLSKMPIRSNGTQNKVLSGVDGLGYISSGGSMRAPIFYDINDTGYYLDPQGTSRLSILNVTGNISAGGGSSPNWNAAYNWGNHADGGYLLATGNLSWSKITSKPASWLDSSVLVQDVDPSASAFPSGFYQKYKGNGPTGTWFNYINVRHSNATNGHGYQAGMSYYDNKFWFRSYQGSLAPTFQSWEHALGSGGSHQTKSGILQSNASLRAPIFYDSNDTNYYVNPASTSRLKTLNVTGNVSAGGGSSPNWNAAYNWGNHADGGYLATSGKAADANLLDGINSSSFLRSDAGDSFSGTLVGSAQRMMEPNDYGKGVYGKYSSTKFQHVWGMGSSWHLNVSGSSLGNFYGIAYTHSNVGSGSQSGFSHQTLFVSNGSVKTWIGTGVRTVGDLISDASVKAPIFYDSSNTGYYLNPASTSKLSVLTVVGAVTASNFILSSDERKKTKIKDLTRNNINANWKSFEMKNDEGEYRTGVIAQELEETHPEFVNTDSAGFKSVKYIDLLIAKIAELEARLEKLEK